MDSSFVSKLPEGEILQLLDFTAGAAKEKDPRRRREACLHVGLPPHLDSRQLTSLIANHLQHQSSRVRAQAAFNLGEVGDQARFTLDRLLATLEDKDEGVRAASALALCKWRALPQDAAPAMFGAMKEASYKVRSAAIPIINNMAPPDLSQRLSAALADPSGHVRLTAASVAVERNDPPLEDVLPVVINELGEMKLAAKLIRNIGDKALEHLTALAQQGERATRCKAIQAMGHLGRHAQSQLVFLREATNDENAAIRRAAKKAIRRIVPWRRRIFGRDRTLKSQGVQEPKIASGKPRVFISYTGYNSDQVRLVAAWLQHNNVDVWFAENEIPIDQQTDENIIGDLIERGIQECTHFLLFTNRRYADSSWCRLEADKILNRQDLSTNQLIWICVPPDAQVENVYSGLHQFDANRLVWGESDIADLSVLEAVMRRLGWPIPDTMRGLVRYSNSFSQRLIPEPSLWSALDLRGWRFVRNRKSVDLEGGVQFDQLYRRDIAGPISLTVTTLRYPTHREQLGTLPEDDFQLRLRALEVARRYQAELEGEFRAEVSVHGIHCVCFRSRRHFGMSYVIRSNWSRFAARKYVLAYQGNDDHEVVFTFHVHGGEKRLLALSPLFDSVIHSMIRYPPRDFSGFDDLDPAHMNLRLSMPRLHPFSADAADQLSALSLPEACFEGVPATRRCGWLANR